MSRIEKRLRRWRENTPAAVPKKEIVGVLDRYFPGRHEGKSGSHIVVRDPRLRNLADFGPNGEFTVVVESGQRVKRRYLKRVAQAVAIIEEMEDEIADE